MLDFLKLFEWFNWRKENLQKIKRYGNYKTIYYRTDVYFHSMKVYFLVKSIIPYVKSIFWDKFDENKATIMALVHDDAELLTWDFWSSQTVLMNSSEIAEYENIEEKSIYILSKSFPEFIWNYIYKNLLLEILHYSTLEAQLVKYIDHVDWYCEAMHEILAGNKCILADTRTQYGLLPIPPEYYYNRFNNLPKYYSLISDLFKNIDPFYEKFENPEVYELNNLWNPFLLSDLYKETNIPIYDWWKNVLLNSLTSENIKYLVTQTEYNL